MYALAVYAHLSNGTVGGVSYVPDGVHPAVARKLRAAVDAYPLLS